VFDGLVSKRFRNCFKIVSAPSDTLLHAINKMTLAFQDSRSTSWAVVKEESKEVKVGTGLKTTSD
jgi:hypothetical protein